MANQFTTSEDILEYHYNYVKRTVPEDRLYWIRLSDGWAPMCSILGKLVPSDEFPRANDSEAVERTARYVFQRTAMTWAGIVAGVGVVYYAVWYSRQ